MGCPVGQLAGSSFPLTAAKGSSTDLRQSRYFKTLWAQASYLLHTRGFSSCTWGCSLPQGPRQWQKPCWSQPPTFQELAEVEVVLGDHVRHHLLIEADDLQQDGFQKNGFRVIYTKAHMHLALTATCLCPLPVAGRQRGHTWCHMAASYMPGNWGHRHIPPDSDDGVKVAERQRPLKGSGCGPASLRWPQDRTRLACRGLPHSYEQGGHR